MRREEFQREVREELEGERPNGRPPFTPALMRHTDLPEDIEILARTVIGCAIEVHRHLGAGLLEKLYEDAIVYELRSRGIPFEQQAEIAVVYKDTVLRGQRLDLIVGELIVIELKSVQQILDVHVAQTLSYLRAADRPLGLLLNFNVPVLADGIRRVLNDRWMKRHMRPTGPVPPPPPSSSSRPSR